MIKVVKLYKGKDERDAILVAYDGEGGGLDRMGSSPSSSFFSFSEGVEVATG